MHNNCCLEMTSFPANTGRDREPQRNARETGSEEKHRPKVPRTASGHFKTGQLRRPSSNTRRPQAVPTGPYKYVTLQYYTYCIIPQYNTSLIILHFNRARCRLTRMGKAMLFYSSGGYIPCSRVGFEQVCRCLRLMFVLRSDRPRHTVDS